MFNFFKKKNTSGESKDKIASMPANDGMLLSYQEKAQEELPYLIEFMETHKDLDAKLFRYAVKSNFKEEDKSEHMWAQVYEFKDGYFIGKLANEPASLKLIKYADDVKVDQAEVEDWILEDFLTHTKVGGFSSQYLRDNANKNASH